MTARGRGKYYVSRRKLHSKYEYSRHLKAWVPRTPTPPPGPTIFRLSFVYMLYGGGERDKYKVAKYEVFVYTQRPENYSETSLQRECQEFARLFRPLRNVEEEGSGEYVEGEKTGFEFEEIDVDEVMGQFDLIYHYAAYWRKDKLQGEYTLHGGEPVRLREFDQITRYDQRK